MDRPAEASSESWHKLADAADDASFAAAWLGRLVHNAGGVEAAVLVAGPPDAGPFRPLALWPAAAACPPPLMLACERAMASRLAFTARDGQRVLLAQPLLRGPQLFGVAAFALADGRHVGELRAWLDAAGGWLVARFAADGGAGEGALNERLLTLLDLTLLALGEARADAAANAVLTETAVRLGCDRVSVGFSKGPLVAFAALSHAADAARRIDLARALEAAMNEAAEQGESLRHAEGPLAQEIGAGAAVRREHARLVREFGNEVVLSVPFAAGGGRHGVLLFEWAGAVDAARLDEAEALAAVLGRVLLERRHADRGLWQRLRDGLRTEAERLAGPRHGMRKLAALAVLALAAFFTFAEGEHRVAAQASLEGGVRRQIVAPFDGFVASAQVRAGQQVEAGALLATLDDRDLRLEASRWASQQDQYTRQARDAEAQSNLAQIQIAMAQTRQAAAQRALSEAQLERSRVSAPFAGLITAGDLSQQLGGAVKKGQTLFEIAPLDSYRIVLDVDEADIDWLAEGQQGRVVLTALPGETLPFTVSLVTPVAKAREGRNLFRVEATLDERSPRLRPGMEGIGKVVVGERRLIWIWTHRLFDWLRLQAWAWLGI